MNDGEKKAFAKFVVPPLLFLFLFLSSAGFAATQILNVRHWSAPDHTRVVFDLDSDPDYTYALDHETLTVEFAGAFSHPSLPTAMNVAKPGIRALKFAAEGEKTKASLELADYSDVQVFKLKKFLDKPDRLVVDIYLKATQTKDASPVQPALPVSTRVIVIDPGHGGEDPGAVGRRGTYEKDIVLSISRELKKQIDAMPGYRAVLTRDGDYYVSFNRRLQIAREANASLFISVHADATRNRRARGSSVYCLSTGGASSEAARLLANNENLSDIVGGVANGEGNNESDPILLNMFQTNTINLSKTFASSLIDSIGNVHYLKYDSLQEAPFRVLKLLDIPAVLLETAFISNAQEEKLLKTSAFQKKMASAAASAVGRYFACAGGAPPSTAAVRPGSSATRAEGGQTFVPSAPSRGSVSYRVRRGDTLYSIARQHNTTLSALLKLNAMKKTDTLRVGQRLQVPVPAGERSTKSYLVKKGDTLYSLARNHACSIEELRRLNNMTSSDALLSGQRIRLPQ